MDKISIRFYNDREVRAIWDEEKGLHREDDQADGVSALHTDSSDSTDEES